MSKTPGEENSNIDEQEGSDSEEHVNDMIEMMLRALESQNEAVAQNDNSTSESDEDDEDDFEMQGEYPAFWNQNHLFDQLARVRELRDSQEFEILASGSEEEADSHSSVLENLETEGKLIQGSSVHRLDHFDLEPNYYSNCSVSTRHFQLRHQIWCHPSPGEAALKSYFAAKNEGLCDSVKHINPEVLSQFDNFVYFVYNWFIMQLNFKTGQTCVVKSLSYYPQGLHVSYGLAACCGSKGQLTVVNLFNNNIIFHHDNVSNGTLNNCVHIAFFSYKVHVLCCSNNQSIRVWELMEDSLEDVGFLSDDAPINFCSVSPDAKNMVYVGDTSAITLVTLRDKYSNNQAICNSKKVVTFPDGLSDGFSVSWSSSSTMFAVARLTPGLICVWNSHTMDLMCVIKPTTADATCLSVKFFEPEDGTYAQVVPPEKKYSEEVLLAPKKRSHMILFTQRDLSAHLVHLTKKTEQTFSPLTHSKLKEHVQKEAELAEAQQTEGVVLPGESDEQPIPKSFTKNNYRFSPRIGGATFSTDHSKIFIGFENFIAEYKLRPVRSLLDSCILYLRKNPEIWVNCQELIPVDLQESLEATKETSLHM